MRIRKTLPQFSLSPACAAKLALLAFAVTGYAGRADPEREPASVIAAQRDLRRSIELVGTLVPREPIEVGYWPAEWAGELTFGEVLAHGSFVNAGDTVARLDSARIDEEIESAVLELASSTAAHAVVEERAEQESAQAVERVEDARYASERARAELEGWEHSERDLRRREEELSAQYTQHSIDDQTHELEQLEAMYGLDELVDATEEIVLARSRRDLARSHSMQILNLERTAFTRAKELPALEHQKRQALERAETALQRLVRMQELEARTRADGVLRSRSALEEKRERLERLRADRALLVLRAPRSGITLHGSQADQGPGRARPQHERGGRASAKAALFTLYGSEALDVAVQVGEKQLVDLRSGMAACVQPLATPLAELVGRFELTRAPLPGTGLEASFAGRVALEKSPVGLVAGMHVQVEVAAESLPLAILLPASAVMGSGSEAHAWVQSAAGIYERRGVVVRARLGSEVVIESGVQAGERVLLGEPAP